MPKIRANNITMNYEQEGAGEPLLLIPYLAADNACYAFQVADYAKQFTCISVDPRGAGESDKPAGLYSTELFADDIAGLLGALGIERAHVAGLSLGAATGLWLAGKYPERVKSLSLHSCWTRSDPFLKTVVQGWQTMAKGLGSVTEMVIQGIFPWCFTPELYAAKPEYIEALAAFVRGRPQQPLDAFLRQSDAVIGHDAPRAARAHPGTDPDHLRPPRHRHLDPLRGGDEERHRKSELVIFEGCSHAPIYENVAEFNGKTLAFLQRQVG
jgi:pimeloyl-ACP methyl ester carboxylesterase